MTSIKTRLQFSLFLSICLTSSAWGSTEEEVSGGIPIWMLWAVSDSDKDGVKNVDDAFPRDPNEFLDTDKDGVGNNADVDDDGDGVADGDDAFPLDPAETLDTDNDGTGNNADTDDDGDGVPDVIDQSPLAGLDFSAAHAFLTRSTFGATNNSIARVQTLGIEGWIDEQLALSSAYDSPSDEQFSYLELLRQFWELKDPSLYGAGKDEAAGAPVGSDEFGFRTTPTPRSSRPNIWLSVSIEAEDQLRQRVAFALHELFVVSIDTDLLKWRGDGLYNYYDVLARNAFGNYSDLLLQISKNVAMGHYLTHHGNSKSFEGQVEQPDENYAREIMQLFTIGIWRLNNDGTPVTDSGGNLIPAYSQADVEALSRVFTGWDMQYNFNRQGDPVFGLAGKKNGAFTLPMECNAAFHDTDEKIILGQTIPSGGSCESDLSNALAILMSDTNMGPFVSRHLIKRLVTSNPSPAYIDRVATVFNDDGTGVKGNLAATIKAILLDSEALDYSGYGSRKFKEPIMFTLQILRAFDAQAFRWEEEGRLIGKHQILRDPAEGLLQYPMYQDSVFNFFESDYVPASAYFTQNAVTAPEFSLYSQLGTINLYNSLREITHLEKNRLITTNDLQDINEYDPPFWFKGYIDFTEEYDLIRAKYGAFEAEGIRETKFTNGNNAVLKAGIIETLQQHLNAKLLGRRMSGNVATAIQTTDGDNDEDTYPDVCPDLRFYELNDIHSCISDLVLLFTVSNVNVTE